MKKIVGGTKDDNGIYIPESMTKSTPEPTDVSIDDLLKSGLQIIKKAIGEISKEVNLGSPSREAIMNLKDLMSMLKDLKKDEKDFLDNATDEQLEKMLKK